MTDEKYRPTKLDDALVRIAEECSEVIKIVCKAQRFGLNDHHPKKGLKKNIDLLLEELADVETAKADFLRILAESLPAPAVEKKDEGDFRGYTAGPEGAAIPLGFPQVGDL